MVEVLDGKKVAAIINQETGERVKKLKHPVRLAVIYDSENAGSAIYVGMKTRQASKIGVETVDIALTTDTDTAMVQELVEELNEDDTITGILVQSPLPTGVNEQVIFSAVAPAKDVDGLGVLNQGYLFTNSPEEYAVAATPQGVMTLLKHYQIEVSGKTALVIGRSQLFGRPMAALLNNADATVIQTHQLTSNKHLQLFLKTADIVIVGVGEPDFIEGNDFKDGAVVIDVGMNVVDGRTVGDVNYQSAAEVASYITPVPGGVGPMTIATLLANTVTAAERK